MISILLISGYLLWLAIFNEKVGYYLIACVLYILSFYIIIGTVIYYNHKTAGVALTILGFLIAARAISNLEKALL